MTERYQTVVESLKPTSATSESLLLLLIFLIAGAITTITLITEFEFPCYLATVCTSPMKTVTLSRAVFYSGIAANSSSGATATLLTSFQNPGLVTYVSAVEITDAHNSALKIVTWDNSSLPSSPSNEIDFALRTGDNRIASATARSFTFYPMLSSTMQIKKGTDYEYVVTFSNGQSVAGTVIAE